MRQIPRTMSTQHPDNAFAPLWQKDKVIVAPRVGFEPTRPNGSQAYRSRRFQA